MDGELSRLQDSFVSKERRHYSQFQLNSVSNLNSLRPSRVLKYDISEGKAAAKSSTIANSSSHSAQFAAIEEDMVAVVGEDWDVLVIPPHSKDFGKYWNCSCWERPHHFPFKFEFEFKIPHQNLMPTS